MNSVMADQRVHTEIAALRNQVSTLTGGTELPVSRSRKKPFLEALTRYFGGQLR